MQNAECRMQKVRRRRILHSAFCILHFAAFAEADVASLPLANLELDGGPSVSTSFEWINGQSSRRKVLRWSAHPLAPGNALVGPVVVHGAGGQVETLPQIALEVLPHRAMELTDP